MCNFKFNHIFGQSHIKSISSTKVALFKFVNKNFKDSSSFNFNLLNKFEPIDVIWFQFSDSDQRLAEGHNFLNKYLTIPLLKTLHYFQ